MYPRAVWGLENERHTGGGNNIYLFLIFHWRMSDIKKSYMCFSSGSCRAAQEYTRVHKSRAPHVEIYKNKPAFKYHCVCGGFAVRHRKDILWGWIEIELIKVITVTTYPL